MGIIAEGPRVQLDGNVVSGLVLDDAARDCVREYRRNGAKILLSPSVVLELARAPLKKREKLMAAAIEYCDGFTNLPVLEILALEVKCINEGARVPAVPIIPIDQLRRAALTAFAPRPGGQTAKARKASNVSSLADMRRAARNSKVPASFEDFLRIWRAHILKGFTDKLAADGLAPALRTDGKVVNTYGVGMTIVMFAANWYRAVTGTMLKGEGSFSDLQNVVEVAHSDVLLTRDEELFECGKLMRSVVTDSRPDIRLVPRP